MKRTYGFRPLYFLAHDDSGNIRSGIAAALVRNLFQGRKLCSYPFSDHCDPLLGDPEDFAPLVQAMQDCARQNGDASIEIRCFRNQVPSSKIKVQRVRSRESGVGSQESGVRIQNPERRTRNAERGTNFVLPLTAAPEQLFKNFHRSCIQRPIRKAEREGVTVDEGEDETDLKQYFRLHLMTRRRLGMPSQPFSFFRNLWQEFAPTNRLTLLLAKHEGAPVAGMILLHHGSTTVYKFGASDPGKQSLGVNPLLFWRAIQLACSRGDALLDLGKTEADHKGLAQFKRRLGAEGIPLNRLVDSPSSLTLEKSLAVRFGRLGLRLAPAALGRAFGASLYRYFA